MSQQLRLRIPAKPEYLVLGRLALTGLSRLHPIDPEDLRDLKLALTEAASNAVRHAYPDRPGLVEIAIGLDRVAIAVEVADEGCGFEPAAVERSERELEEGGLGLSILAAVVDELEIEARRGDGTRVRFRKRIVPPADERRSR
jgi:serine/threonine-protein kinase RsbW